MSLTAGRRSLGLMLPFSLGACATIFNGSTHELTIASTRPATVTIINNKQQPVTTVTTPAKVELKGYEAPYVLRFRDDAGNEKTYEVKKTVSGIVFGNLIIGGVIGFGIDAATGSLYTLKPDKVTLDMTTGVNLDFPESPAKAPESITR